jgi:hypothetical protein
MRVSLNTFVQVIIILTIVCIFGWNLLSMKEGLTEEDDTPIDETKEIIDSKTGKKRKMTKREKREAQKKRDAEEKANNEDIDERIKSFNK